MGKWPDFEYQVGKWLKYDRLILTHLNQPWGPHWTLETLGDPWRPLATCLKMVILAIFRHNIQNRAISPLKFPLKTKSDLPISLMGL